MKKKSFVLFFGLLFFGLLSGSVFASASDLEISFDDFGTSVYSSHFGLTGVGYVRTNLITVVNNTGMDISLNPHFDNVDESEFSISGLDKNIIRPKESAVFKVKFTPLSSSGYHSSSFYLTDDEIKLVATFGFAAEELDNGFYLYEVGAGETVTSIAKMFKMKREDLYDAFGFDTPIHLRSGIVVEFEKSKSGVTDLGVKGSGVFVNSEVEKVDCQSDIGSNECRLFSDIVEGDYSLVYLKKLVNAGLIKGYLDGSFKPDRSVNRAEFVKIVINAFKKSEMLSPPIGQKLICPDTPTNEWYSNSFYTAKQLGVIQGYPEAGKPESQWLCRPGQTVNKVEALKIVLSLAEVDVSSVDENIQYGDTSKGQWYSLYSAFSKANDLINVDDDNKLNPDQPMTRRELVALVGRLFN